MKRKLCILLFLIISLLFLSSCQQKTENEAAEPVPETTALKTEIVKPPMPSMTKKESKPTKPKPEKTVSELPEDPIKTPAVFREETKRLVKGNNKFALDIYKQASSKSSDNIFFSPASISIALGMTYAGSGGETRKQFEEVLHLPKKGNEIHKAFAMLSNMMECAGDKKECSMDIANRLWGAKGYKFLEPFLEVTEKFYKAKLTQLDFSEPNKARNRINTWVEGETNEKIKDLIPEGILTPDTKLVLTNAIYFKGFWEQRFKKDLTKDGEFKVSKDKKVTVPLMTQKHDYKYKDFGDLKVLEMPYKGKNFSMIVLLPKEAGGIKKLEESVTMENLEKWTSNLMLEEVIVYFPRFKMSSNFELSEVLKALGLTQAFSRDADFSRMTGTKELFISAVLHKGYVDVNEKGTEAAAATAVVMKPKGIPMKIEFRADHPFIFLIRENTTGSIMFMGRVMDPSDAQ